MVKLFTSPNYQRWRNLICFALVLLAFLGALDLAIGTTDPKAYSPLQTLPQGNDLQGYLGVSIKVTPPSSNPDDPAVITLTEVLATGNTTRIPNPVAGPDLSAPKYSRI